MPSQCSFRPKTLKALVSLVGVRRFSSHIHVLGPMGSTRLASWLKFAPGEFVILGVLPATLRVALRSKIAPGDFVNFRPLPPEGRSFALTD